MFSKYGESILIAKGLLSTNCKSIDHCTHPVFFKVAIRNHAEYFVHDYYGLNLSALLEEKGRFNRPSRRMEQAQEHVERGESSEQIFVSAHWWPREAPYRIQQHFVDDHSADYIFEIRSEIG